MPVGVKANTLVRAGSATTAAPPEARYLVVGMFDRGPTSAPTLITSYAQLVAVFGVGVTYGMAWDDLRAYFAEGGAEAYVLRVVGPAATYGTLSLKDSTGTPVNWITVSAVSQGPWSTSTSIEVVAGTTTGTKRLNVYSSGTLVERFDNLDNVLADNLAAINRSAYVTAAAAASYTGTVPGLGLLTPTALGTSIDDHASVTATMVVTALNTVSSDYGPMAVALPGYDAATVGTQLIAHATATRRIAILSGAVTDQRADIVTKAAALISATGHAAGILSDWLNIPDADGISVRQISGEGVAAAMRARAIIVDGAWREPAGDIAVTRFVLSTVRNYTSADADFLYESHVSPWRNIAGSPRLYGWRALDVDDLNWPNLNMADEVNVAEWYCLQALESIRARKIDGRGDYFALAQGIVTGVLGPRADAGAYFDNLDDSGNEIDPGYSVAVGAAQNPIQQLAQNHVTVNAAVRLAPDADLITLNFYKVALTASV